MQQVLGPNVDLHEARRLTRAAFANYARYMVDLVRMPHLHPGELLANVRIEGWEHVEDAFNVGKGVVFATGHIGNWDLAGAAFAATGRDPGAGALERTRAAHAGGRWRQSYSDRIGRARHAHRPPQARGPGGAGR